MYSVFAIHFFTDKLLKIHAFRTESISIFHLFYISLYIFYSFGFCCESVYVFALLEYVNMICIHKKMHLIYMYNLDLLTNIIGNKHFFGGEFGI